MARRYGGKYSPGAKDAPTDRADDDFRGARVNPVGARANLMFLPAVVLLFTGLMQGALGLVFGLVGAAAMGLGSWLLRGGLEAEAAYHARKAARRPAIPRKIFAAVLAGAGVGLGALAHGSAPLAAVLYGLATGALHLAAFGIDPLQDKGMSDVDRMQQDRVARVVEQADTTLAAMRDALQRLGDRSLTDRLSRFEATVRKLIRTVEEDPRDLRAARRYLGIYLLGARDATVKFTDLYAQNRDASVRDDYLALLDDLERNFAARREKLLLDDHSDLTVEIEVLRDRLDREGVRLPDAER